MTPPPDESGDDQRSKPAAPAATLDGVSPVAGPAHTVAGPAAGPPATMDGAGPSPGAVGPPGTGISIPHAVPDGYDVVRCLGEGGMGAVYLARHRVIGRLVALKYLHSNVPGIRERFLREGRVLGSLVHPNIVQALDFQLAGEAPLLICEFVEGSDLAALITAEAPMSPSRAVPLMRQILEGLSHAHAVGVVHRDLKPANVLVSPDGTAKLADFGIATSMDVQGELTRTGMLLGTPAYMAPEQAAGRRVDHRADLYAFGILVFEMFTGRRMFDAPGAMDILRLQMTEPPQRLDAVRPELAGTLTDVVGRCLEKDPNARPMGADELLVMLQSPDVTRLLPRTARSTRRVAILAPPAPVAEGDKTMVESAPGPVPTDSSVQRRQAGSPRSASGPSSAQRRTTGKIATIAPVRAPETAGRPSVLKFGAVGLVLLLAITGIWWSLRPADSSPVTSLPIVAGSAPAFAEVKVSAATLLGVDATGPFLNLTLTEPVDLKADLILGTGSVSLGTAVVAGRDRVFRLPIESILKKFEIQLIPPANCKLSQYSITHEGVDSLVDGWVKTLGRQRPPGLESSRYESGRNEYWMDLVLSVISAAQGPASAQSWKDPLVSRKLGDPVAWHDRLLALGRAVRSRWPVEPQLARLLLERPLSQVSLGRKQRIYDALTGLRLIQRLLTANDVTEVDLQAEVNLGKMFATGPSATVNEGTASIEASRTLRHLLVGPAFLEGVDIVHMGHDIMKSSRKKLAAQDEARSRLSVNLRLKSKSVEGTRWTNAALRLGVRSRGGATEKLGPAGLVWVRLLDRTPWTLLLHAGCFSNVAALASGGKRGGDGETSWLVHSVEPSLVSNEGQSFELRTETVSAAGKKGLQGESVAVVEFDLLAK